MGLPRKFKKEEADGLDAVDAQIAGARRLAEEIARYREDLFKKTGCVDEEGGFLWTEELNAYGAGIAYATLVYLAEHGDRESAKWVAEKGLGAPVQPFSVRIQNLPDEDIQREMVAILADHMEPERAHELAVLLAAGEVPELPEGDEG